MSGLKILLLLVALAGGAVAIALLTGDSNPTTASTESPEGAAKKKGSKENAPKLEEKYGISGPDTNLP